MIDFHAAHVRGHRRNIERYCSLATELTDFERQYLHKRIAEEYAQLERLNKSEAKRHRDVVVAENLLRTLWGRSALAAEPLVHLRPIFPISF
jgi:hypothetical protein